MQIVSMFQFKTICEILSSGKNKKSIIMLEEIPADVLKYFS